LLGMRHRRPLRIPSQDDGSAAEAATSLTLPTVGAGGFGE
jgi:hypothetical protein